MNILDNINVDRMMSTLPYVGKGMLGIFIVIGVLVLVVLALNKFTVPKK